MGIFEVARAFKSALEAGLAATTQDIQETRDNLYSGLRNQTVSGTTASDALTAAADISALTTQVSNLATQADSTLTQLASGGGGGGNDQFNRVGTDLGTDWDVLQAPSAGSLITDGSSVTWDPSGSSTGRVVARNAIYKASTDYQTSRLILKSPLNTTSGWLLITRCNDAKTSYTYAYVKKNYREIGYVISGAKTVLESRTHAFDPPPGQMIELVSGLRAGQPDWIRLYSEPGNPASTIDSLSTAPLYGPDYRNFGFGVDIQASGGVQVSPGSADLWTAFDHLSPPVVGCFFQANRSGSSISPGPSSGGMFANNVFNNVLYQSNGFTYEPGINNRLRVDLPGAYHVQIDWPLLTTLGSAVATLRFYVNGAFSSVKSFSQSFVGDDISFISLSGVVYLEAGDTIQPGYGWSGFSGPPNIAQTTPRTAFTVTKLSPPYF